MVRLEFKGFYGTFEWVENEGEYFGKIDEITDLVTFTGGTLERLLDAFRDSVEDYILLCEELGKKHFK